MNKILLNLYFVSFFLIFFANSKEILVFMSKGGGGHISAANAVSNALKDDYNIKIISPLSDPDIFGKFDVVKKMSFNLLGGEDLYNILLRNRWHWAINQLSKFGSKWIKTHQKKLNDALFAYIKKNKPDMIISVMPFINGIILKIAQHFNISFLAIPTDLGIETFALGIHCPKYDKFKFSLPFKDPFFFRQIKRFNIPKTNITTSIGYPLRPSFFEPKDKEKIKEELNLPKDKSLIMILMGSEGSNAIYSYVYNIAKGKKPLHLIICIGRNEMLREKIAKIKFPNNITSTIFGFTDKIADLLAVADVYITKPGGQSVCEDIQMGIPILVDETGISLKWEKINSDFIKKNGLGQSVKNVRKINNLIDKYLNDEKLKNKIRQNFAKLKRKSFKEPLLENVNKMMLTKERDSNAKE